MAGGGTHKMKPINRRSFFRNAAGLLGLASLSPFAVLAGGHKQLGADITVKIDAGDIDRELEKCMYKILEKIQVRASEEGADLLLGR